MALLKNQAEVSGQTPMPVERVDDTSTVNTSSAETVVWYFISSGAYAAAVGEAAGTIVTAKLTYTGVTNSMGTALGTFNDTSLSFAAATRAETLVTVQEDLLSKMLLMSPTDQIATITTYLATAGDYIVDHRRGQIWLKSKATVANDSATYKYSATLSGGGAGDKVDVIKVGGSTTPASATDGLLVNLGSNNDVIVDRLTSNVGVGLQTDVIMNDTTALTPKFAFANVAASQTDSNIVTAVPTKKIRVIQVGNLTGATATNLTFNTKPAGAGTAISPLFANGANGGEILPFSSMGWFETVAGEGLTVTTGAGATTGILVGYIEV